MSVINVEQIKPGMVLDDDVRDRNGRLLLYAGAEITGKHINIFKTWGVVEANVRGVTAEDAVPAMVEKTDPALLKKVEEDLRGMFRHADLGHPAVSEMFRLCTLRKVRGLSGKSG